MWTKKAIREFDLIYQFWIEHNKSSFYSEKIFDETLRMIKILRSNPEAVQEYTVLGLRRVVILENFSMTYQFKNNKIQIISFFDNRRNPDKI
ncbi:type II toxin-antitoxin system RelE/ParE family toxin [Chryseobacterium sp. 2TAF14]|uniref:type II toxin-antitoxin system RelE/ParE family toxin n=1 Tax=Chryseobacterium sp. 2TAF14 TaxID=3233007 RepID=UPI003F8F229A